MKSLGLIYLKRCLEKCLEETMEKNTNKKKKTKKKKRERERKRERLEWSNTMETCAHRKMMSAKEGLHQ